MKNDKIIWLTLKQAAEHSHLGLKAIKNAVYDIRLPSYKPKGTKHRMVKEHELDEWMEAGQVKVSERREQRLAERVSGAAS